MTFHHIVSHSISQLRILLTVLYIIRNRAPLDTITLPAPSSPYPPQGYITYRNTLIPMTRV